LGEDGELLELVHLPELQLEHPLFRVEDGDWLTYAPAPQVAHEEQLEAFVVVL
jgi:hypothetical protein